MLCLLHINSMNKDSTSILVYFVTYFNRYEQLTVLGDQKAFLTLMI